MEMSVVLAEQFGEEPMLVEMEFERVFGGWLGNSFTKPLCWIFRRGVRSSPRRRRS